VAYFTDFTQVSGSCPDDIDAAAPVTGNQTVEPTLNDNQRDAPTIESTEVIKRPPTPKEEAVEGLTEGLVSRSGMMGATIQRPSKWPSANPGRSSAPVSLRRNDGKAQDLNI
jgi:hypothetical protein